MNHSFWVDEADAVATYVHGQFRTAKKAEPQGALRFVPASWQETFFSGKHGGNNHVAFSIASRLCLSAWQRFTGSGRTTFTEWPLRVPSLLAGLGSLVALACLLRRWGVPWLGLLAAGFMALHPWHVRYSTEARGYAIALCLLPLFLHALTDALERNRWRDWLLFACAEFLLMWTWPGVAYALAFLNVAAAVLMLMRGDHWSLLVRWVTASLLAAGFFISLYAPLVPQIAQFNKTSLWMKGLPMDQIWLHNVLASPFTGILFHQQSVGNPAEINWERLLAQSPWLTGAGFALIIASVAIGLTTVTWRNWRTGALIGSVFVAAAACTLHFKYGIGDEMRTWYLIFTLPCLCICAAAGFRGIAWGISAGFPTSISAKVNTAVLFACLALTTASLWPMSASLVTVPSENLRGVVAATRDK
ncbi:MAG: glycosyltransferase family 39 protein, partial [Roseimicrobium sp.]